MRGVSDRLFLTWLERNAEFDGLGIGFEIGITTVLDLPVCPAVEVLDNADFDGFIVKFPEAAARIESAARDRLAGQPEIPH